MSQLPEWMRNPARAERTTLSWQIKQSMRRTWIWRLGSRWRARLQNRYRITARYPKTTATLAWFLAVGTTIALYYVIMVLYSRII